MKNLCTIFILSLCLFVMPAPAWSANFLDSMNDIPLIKGLSELTDEQILFDKPDGRIVTATAVGNLPRQKVLQFYHDTLPQLGWTEIAMGHYQREKENLKISFSAKDGTDFVYFTLSPKP